MEKNKLKVTILSLSLLTVMSGAAVSPALGNIKQHFSSVDPSLIKMILTIPGLFIMLVSLVFPLISKRFDIKKIALFGLVLYTVGGSMGAFAWNIYLLLLTRVILGIGVGLIVPLSTGLLAFYFDQKDQKKLMGYSVAMNNIGGIAAMSLSGYLAAIEWNYSFYVYLLGLFVIGLVLLFLPKERIERSESKLDIKLVKEIIVPLVSMFLMMIAFYAYITNFSILATQEGIIESSRLGLVMSFQSIGALLLAFFFGKLSSRLGEQVKYLGLVLFISSFILLLMFNHPMVYMLALLLCGAGMGITMPQINASAVKKVDKKLAPSIMAMVSVAMYLGQFLSPVISSSIMATFNIRLNRFPYAMAIISVALIMVITASSDLKTMMKSRIGATAENKSV